MTPDRDNLIGYVTLTSPGVWTFTFVPTAFDWTTATDMLFAQAEDPFGASGDPFAPTLRVR